MVVMVVNLSVATLCNAHGFPVCFSSFSGLPVCCKFPRGCRCYELYCQSLYVIVGEPDQKWHEVTSLMLLLGRNQLKLRYLVPQQIHLVLPRHKWGVWLAMLVHTDANSVHVCSVGIVCLAIRLVWLFDYIWQVHAWPSGPRRCWRHLGPFWLQQGEYGLNKA